MSKISALEFLFSDGAGCAVSDLTPADNTPKFSELIVCSTPGSRSVIFLIVLFP